MSALWTLDAMVTAMHADRAGSLPKDVSGISIDSRTLAKGDAFSPFKAKTATVTSSSRAR